MQKIAWTGICFFLILSFLFQFPSQAQSKKFFIITGKIVPEEPGNGNGTIDISKNGKDFSKIDISKNGRFRLELDFFNEFNLNFIYPGHFNKIITVSTQIPQEVWERDNDFPPFPMIVQLLKEIDGIDKSFTLKPMGRIFYGKDIDNFEKESYVSDMQFLQQVETARNQNSQVQKEAQAVSKENAQDLAAKQKNFDQLIKEADTYYQRGEYQTALLKYKDAQKLFPDRAYPNDRVAELQDLVKALEMAERQKTELEDKYKAAITRANGFFEQKSYAEARPKYEEALQYKPGDVFSTGRINEIDQLLASIEKQLQYKDLIAKGDQSYQSRNLDQALNQFTEAARLMPGEKYPQDQISKITKDKLELSQKEQSDREFNQLMTAAGEAARQKDYLKALDSYKKALTLKPDSKLAQDKIDETNLAIASVENEKRYLQAIHLADQALAGKDLVKAKAQYQEAIRFKSGESYPKNKLAEISQTEANELKFSELVSGAEKSFSNGQYTEALNSFNQALKLKPDDQPVKNRVSDIQKIMNEQEKEKARLTKEYQTFVAQADKSLENKDYANAKTAYQKALGLKAEETYPKDQIRKIDETLAELKLQAEEKVRQEKEKQDQAFNQAMASADQAFAENNFEAAKTGYLSALTIKPNDLTAKEKLGKAEAKLAEIGRMNQAYSAAIDQANKFLTVKKFPEAKSKYEEALQYMPDKEYPKQQIARINEELARQEVEAKTRKDFDQAVAEGESLLKTKDLAKAKEAYMRAYNLIPSEPVPPKKISEINVLLAEQTKKESELKATQEAYLAAIGKADKHFGNKEYPLAQLAYSEAQLIKPDEKYPTDQLSLIEKLLREQTEQNYKEAIAKADNFFTGNQLDESALSYQEALKIKKNDLYATNRLKEIDLKKKDQEAEKLRLKKLDEQYNAAIADADNDFKNKAFPSSRSKYQKALSLKPAETYPQQQLAQIDQLLADQQKAADLNRQYEQIMKEAKTAFDQKKLKEALALYQQGKQLKPEESQPPVRIAEIEKLLAQHAETARLAAQEEAKRMEQEKADREQYANVLATADKAFGEKQYKIARNQYSTALSLLPQEKYPKDQIAKIDDLLAQEAIDKSLAMQKAERDSLQKTKDKLFDQAMQNARDKEQNKLYNEAIQKYNVAISIKPEQKPVIQKYIKDLEAKLLQMAKQEQDYNRIIKQADNFYGQSKLNEALAEYNNALKVKQDEEYPKNQITAIQQKLAAFEQSYADAIKNADDAYNAEDWATAKVAYSNALGMKPAEQYPADRIKDINKKIAAANLAAASKAANEKAYQEAFDKAEKLFSSDQLVGARMQFQVAQTLKPEEKRPAERIQEIDALLDQRKKEELAKAQRELDEKYGKALTLADNSFREKSYNIARLQYQQAQSIKPLEAYPKDQITLIDQLMKEVKAAETSKAQAPKIEEETPKQSANVYIPEQATSNLAASFAPVAGYDEAIHKADDSFGVKDYPVARFYYYKASELKPTETYPKQQIEAIRKIIDSQLSSVDISAYSEAINQADNAFASKNYPVAKFYYYKAMEIKSWEQYPKDRINEILALTNSFLTEKEEQEYRAFIAKADEALVNKDISIARFYYNKAASIKHDEEYPKIKLNDIRKMVEQEQADLQNKEYQQLVDTGDQAFKEGNYSLARFNYNKALTIRPDEKYPKDQLKLIREALEKKSN